MFNLIYETIKMKIWILLFFSLFSIGNIEAQDSVLKKDYFYFPGSYKTWSHKYCAGISLMRLPNEIIEEEISSLPMINCDFALGLPKKFLLKAQLSTNYISNRLSVAIQKSIFDKKFALAIGVNTSLWYGQLNQEVIHLRAFGVVFNPYIVGGIHFKDYYLSLKLDNQYGFMRTFSDKAMLGKSSMPNSAYSVQFAVEQPLWNNHWVALGVKLNYATFQYQSWLVYSALNQHLLYPEYSFTFLF